ncbi:uncharacterized protein G6M90_00g074160 [Metarhizium brunneum]|uniref:Uncharacterized protein n=1 Tax=Metarhizium brunneum TaxID=500148 RepID=A0A7D5UZ69_9HYPO
MYVFNLVYSWLGRDPPPSANSHVTSHQRKIHKRTSRNAPDLMRAGATGLVGSSVLSRKPVPVTHNTQSPHINIIIHPDFERYDALAAAVGVPAIRLIARLPTCLQSISAVS